MLDALPVCTNDIAIYGRKAICALSNANAICRVDIETCETKLLYEMECQANLINLFAYTFRYEDKVVFVPYRAKKIVLYAIENNEFSEIDMPGICEKSPDFFNAVLYENAVLMYGEMTGIVIYDINNNAVRTLYTAEVEQKKTVAPRGMIVRGSDVYIPQACGSFLRIDMNKLHIDTVEMIKDNGTVLSASYYEDKILALVKNVSSIDLVICEIDKPGYESIAIGEVSQEIEYTFFHPPIAHDEKIYLFPYSNAMGFYVVDLQRKCTYRNKAFIENINGKEEQLFGLWFLKQFEEGIMFQSRSDNTWYLYDLNRECVIKHWKSFVDSPKLINEINYFTFEEKIKKSSLIQETGDSLKYLLRYVSKK